MPHISVKLYPGRSEQQKSKFAEEVVKLAKATFKCDEKHLSVDIQDIDPTEWARKVYGPEIEANWDRLYKKPGYEPPR